eukprot:6173718-Pleurochrysis_carterae.AAC.2
MVCSANSSTAGSDLNTHASASNRSSSSRPDCILKRPHQPDIPTREGVRAHLSQAAEDAVYGAHVADAAIALN